MEFWNNIPNEQSIVPMLRGFLFWLILETNILLVQPPLVGKPQDQAETPPETKPAKSKRWSPLATSWSYRVSILAISVIIMTALEVSHQMSNPDTGLSYSSATGPYSRYAWLFLPTAIMTCLSSTYGAMDSAIKMLAPYHRLRKDRKKDFETLRYDPLGDLSVTAIWRATKGRDFDLSAIIITSILGPFLAIIASGLFTETTVADSQDVVVGIQTWFEIREPESNPSLGLDTVSTRAILFNNMSYPSGTHDGFSLATLNLTQLSSFQQAITPTGAFNSSSPPSPILKVRLPAVRGQLNCTMHDLVDLCPDRGPCLAIRPPNGCAPPQGIWDSSFIGPESLAATDELELYIRLQNQFTGYRGFFSAYFFADIEPQWVIYNATSHKYKIFTSSLGPFETCDGGALHLFAIVGSVSKPNIYYCLPYLESLYIDVVLDLKGMVILPFNTPREIPELAAHHWGDANTSLNSVTLGYIRQGYNDPTSAMDSSLSDEFFKALAQSEGGVSLSKLLYESSNIHNNTNTNADNRLLQSMNRLYQRMVAQTLHFNFRRSLSDIPQHTAATDHSGKEPGKYLVRQGSTVNGTIVSSSSTIRFTQSVYSTRVLQGLLSTMVICVVVSIVLERRRYGCNPNELPLDPGSLAARMVLLGGIQVLERLPEGDIPAGNGHEHS